MSSGRQGQKAARRADADSQMAGDAFKIDGVR
jgi:hypothetical protein